MSIFRWLFVCLGLASSASNAFGDRVLLESNCPKAPLSAIVEETQTATYMYLYLTTEPVKGSPLLGSVWVRNHKTPPKVVSVDAMKNGEAPLLPAEYCRYREGKSRFIPKDLSLKWYEEYDDSGKTIGYNAALFEKKELISIIPYSTNSEVPGFSKDCIKASRIVSPIPPDFLQSKRHNLLLMK